MRVVDESGAVFLDTDPRYVSIDTFYDNVIDNPPFWNNEEIAIAEIGNALVCGSEMQFTHGSMTMDLYFFRTITSDVMLFDRLRNILLAIAAVGLMLAGASGYVVSKRILKPISDMTKTAHNIAIENMDSRIETRSKMSSRNSQRLSTACWTDCKRALLNNSASYRTRRMN